MTTVSWKSGVSGNWNSDPGDWSTGAPPAAGDDVQIDDSGNFTVAITSPIARINSLTVGASGATVSIIDPGVTQRIAGSFGNSGRLTVDANGTGGSGLAVGGTLSNSGLLAIGNAGITLGSTIIAAAIVNTGTIAVTGNNAGAGAELVLGGGQFTTIAAGAELFLSGADAFVADAADTASNSALVALTDVAGDFELQHGASVALGGDLTVGGTLRLDTQTFSGNNSGGSLAVAGNLTNTGTVTLGFVGSSEGGATLSVGGTITNSGTLNIFEGSSVGDPEIVSATALVDTGTLALDSNGGGEVALILSAGTAPHTVATPISLVGDALLDYQRGEIATIASGGTLFLSGADAFVADAADTASNSALVALTDVAGDFELQHGATVALGGDLTVGGSVRLDTQTFSGNNSGGYLAVAGNLTNTGTVTLGFVGSAEGGATLNVGGTIVNSGTLNIFEGSAVSDPEIVSATALVDTGTLNLDSNGGGEVALILSAGTAPHTVATPISLVGDALLDYQRGGIATIASGGTLFLSGAYAFVADAADTSSNSALIGLTDVAGDFELQHGASVALGGDLTVGGSVRLDTQTFSGNNSGGYLAVAGNLTNTGTVTLGVVGSAEGGATLAVAGTIANYGTLNILEGSSVAYADIVSAAAIANNGVILLDSNGTAGAALTINGNGKPAVFSNYGTITAIGTNVAGIDFRYPGSTLINYGTIIGSSGTAVALDSSGALLVIEPGAVIEGAITGFGPGDTIDLAQVYANQVQYNNGTVSVLYGNTVVETLALSGTFSPSNFYLSPDGSGGTDISIRYITGTYTNTVVIGAKTPTTVAATGAVTVAQGNALVNQGSAAATITNLGTVAASGGSGVYLTAGGTVTNTATQGAYGLIAGYQAGVAVSGGNATIVNSSIIEGTGASGVGVLLGSSGSGGPGARAVYRERLSNYGAISGYIGVMAAGGSDTLTNAGVITGYGGTAVLLGGGDDRLVVDAGAAFYGIADGGGGSSVLELAGYPAALGGRAAPSVGTLAGIGSSFVNFGTLVIDPGASWEASGDGSAYPFVNDGTIIISNGIDAGGEALVLGTVGADPGRHGVIQVGAAGVVDFAGAAAKSQTLMFADAYGTLQLSDPSAFAARITGFQAGDVIDMLGIAANHFTYAKGKMKLTEAGHTVAVLSFAGRYSKADFQLSSDGNGGTLITFAAPVAASTQYFFGVGQGQPEFWTLRG